MILDWNCSQERRPLYLSETFKGVLSAEGLVEVFVSPDFKVDISTTTAMFNVTVNDGELINFTPLQAAG